MQRRIVLALVVGALFGLGLAWYLQRTLLVVVEVRAERVPLDFEDRCATIHADLIHGGMATGGGDYHAIFGTHGQDDADTLAGCYDEAVFEVVTRRANADDRVLLRGEVPECRPGEPPSRLPCRAPDPD